MRNIFILYLIDKRYEPTQRNLSKQNWLIIWDTQYDTSNSIVKSLPLLHSMLRLAHSAPPPPPLNTLFCSTALLANVLTATLLPQQRGALKRRAIMLMEDFKFHIQTVGGNGTWEALDKVLIEEVIHHLHVCSKASIHPNSWCRSFKWSEAMLTAFLARKECWEKRFWMGP